MNAPGSAGGFVTNAGGATDYCARSSDAENNSVKGLAVTLDANGKAKIASWYKLLSIIVVLLPAYVVGSRIARFPRVADTSFFDRRRVVQTRHTEVLMSTSSLRRAGYGSGCPRVRRNSLRLPTAAVAQVATGSIVGTVVDSSGQLVPGAQVTVREVNRNTTTTLTTDAAGVYTAPFLVPGTYEVSVELPGFKSWIRRGIVLQVNDRLRIDASLEVGTVTESTTVQAESPLVRTDSSEVGTVIEEAAVKELPLNGRNFATLVYLAPGITPGQAGENLSGASTFNPRGASNFNALGSQANSNAWLVDGIDNNEFTFNTVIVAPSVEQVREFKVLSGVFSAEFGRGAGVVSVSTKSGTNQLHGTGYEFLRNDAFDARNFFVRKVEAADGTLVKDPVPPLDRHQFGVAIGGAVAIPGLYDGHSRTFFFADYAGIKETRGVTTVNTVPTAAARTGDFSNYRDRNGNLIPIYDPLTTRVDPATGRTVRDQFPNNIIPPDRILSVGRNIASIYPLPNNGSSNFDNYISTPNREITDNAFSGRVDHRLSDHDTFFVRFNYGRFRLDAPQGQANCCLPTPPEAAARFDLGPFIAGIQNTKLTTHGAAFNYSKILTPTFVNELRVGYANTAPFTTQSDYGHYASESLGIHGINISDITTGLPNIGITNFTGISGGPAFLPVNPSQFHYQIEDVLVWLKSRHQVKVRLSARRSPAVAVHPRQHAQRDQLRHELRQQPADQQRRHRARRSAAWVLQQRLARVPARKAGVQGGGAGHVRAGRLQGQQPADRQRRPALRDLQPADREEQPPRQLRL